MSPTHPNQAPAPPAARGGWLTRGLLTLTATALLGAGPAPLEQAAPAWEPLDTREALLLAQARVQAREQARPPRLPRAAQSNRQLEIGEELVEGVLPQADAGGHAPFDGRLTATAVQRAVDDAVQYLRRQQGPDGAFSGEGYRESGATALATLALLAAGGDPASDLGLQRALAWLLGRDDDDTYFRGIRANVLEYALRKTPYDERLRRTLEQDFRWLLDALGQREGWRYNKRSTDWDNSCTQYGVLGLWAAARAGFDAGDPVWRRLSRHFLTVQNEDGGWGYTGGGSGSTPNMATAGLASLFLVFDMVHGKREYRAATPHTFTEGEPAAVLAAIERGMNWLGRSEDPRANGYYLYGIERTGVAGGHRSIGGRDWFAEGARTVLAQQRPDGSIPNDFSAVLGTALSTLFLVHGGAPVVFDKLQTGADPDWNLNPRELANVTRALWSAYERPLSWHIVGLDDPVEQWEAPLLFLSGSRPFRPDEAQLQRLRAYLQRGGTIFAEPSDHSPAFRQSIVELAARLAPGAALAPLPAEHGLYTVVRQSWRARPRLLGLDAGGRTVLFLSEEYLAGAWQRNDLEDDAFLLATNLLFYATDRAPLQGRFAGVLPDSAPLPAGKTTVQVARVRLAAEEVGGGAGGSSSLDADLAAPGWKAAAAYVAHVGGVTLTVAAAPVALHEAPARTGPRLLHLTGRRDFTLTEAERQGLAGYLRQGGTLLVDAWAGSPEFAAAARRELAAVLGGPLQPLDPGSPLALGRFDGGSDLALGMRYKLPARRTLRDAGQDTRAQHLEVGLLEGRPAVVFSALDLSAALGGIEVYQAVGYRPAAARRIVANLVGSLARR